LVDQLDGILLTFRTEATVDRGELLFFLLEVVDIDGDRADQYDQQEE
jgi:hypothetical protein